MKKTYLFPHKWMKVGWILMGISVIWTLLIIAVDDCFDIEIKMFALFGFGKDIFLSNVEPQPSQIFGFNVVSTSIFFTILPVIFFIGTLLAAFSKEKQEDEAIVQLRANSLVWSMLVSYVILILLYLFIYGFVFMYVYMYASYLFIILYLVKFRLVVHKYYKENSNEE